MKTTLRLKSGLALLLSLVMMFSVMTPMMSFMATAISVDETKLGSNTKLTSKTDYAVAPGITESHIITHNKDGSNQVQGFALEVDLSDPTTSVIASYKDYDASKGWGMQMVRDQAIAAEKALGVNVVAGVNGDFYNMGTGQPTGTFVMNGTVYNTNNNWNYFAILNDGTPVIGSGKLDTSNVKECVGGPAVILKDGVITPDGLNSPYGVDQLPRSAVGITADGNIVMFVADGRQAPKSCGQTFKMLAETMIAFGCVDALSLDGGGSSTFVSQHEGSDTIELRNSPCDGAERTVSSALLVCSSAKPSGEFHHASLLPNNNYYTPGSSVEFSAKGVDSSGFAAPLPEDGSYAVADESFGSFTDNVFTSSGKEGTVVVNYMSEGKVSGSTTIEIRTPDELSFAKEELSLAFDQHSDLGLEAKYQGKVINTKAGDFIWELEDAKMGAFEGNTFVASPNESINGTITVKSAYDETVTATMYAVIGRQPYVVWDFEDESYYSFATGYLNANGGISKYLTGDASCNMLLGTYVDTGDIPRGAKGTAEVIDVDSGEVRMGSNALKINYDFTQQPDNKIDGVCIGAYSGTSSMEGTPTAIGLWLYAPEGTPNFWFRMRVLDAGANNGAGAVLTLNFTDRHDSKPADGIGGIDWQGWKYCEAQLTGVGPFALLGGECVRLMNCVNYSGNGDKTVTGAKNPDGTLEWRYLSPAERKGHVFIDNVQFVYGSNTQDVENPIIKSINVGNPDRSGMVNIDANTVFENNEMLIQASFVDFEDKYATGVNYDACRLYIDGKDVTASTTVVDGAFNYISTLANGLHSVKLIVRDNFNNETTETRYFTVNGTQDLPTVRVESADETCVLNKTFTVDFKANAIDKVTGVTTLIKIDKDIIKTAADATVTFAEGFSGTSAYDAEDGTLSITAAGTAAKTADWDNIFSVTFDIPWDVAEGKNFTYRVLEGAITYSDAEITTDSFSSANVIVPVTATYTITNDTIVVGSAGANIYVKDAAGNAVAGVEIYNDDGTYLGTTDKNGAYFSNEFASAAQEFVVYANSGDNYSFKTKNQSFNPAADAEGKPSYVISIATDNAATSKEFGWLASPLMTAEKAQAQYAEKTAYEAEGEAAFATVDGISTLYNYTGSNYEGNRTARINTVDIEGLKEGTEYAYRVGDGAIWSEVMYFTTTVEGTDTKFFVVGDIQAEDLSITNRVFDEIAAKEFDFGLQTGDAVETSSIYNLWTDVLEVFSRDEIQPVDMIHVYGNHELIGDATGDSSKLLFGHNDEEYNYYSVTYGNVYVAVINFQMTNTEEAFLEALEWLKADAAASDAIWKTLSIHSPIYNTNLDANIPWVSENLPAAAQEAGIDVVFTGHDHSYARTSPMIDGEPAENGVVYYICGNTGEKSYSAVIKPEYNFEFFIPRSDYQGIYLDVTANDKEMVINTYDVGMLVDSCIITNESDCVNNGHVFSHNDGWLTCTVCGYKKTVDGYTGVATDEATDRYVNIVDGQLETNKWSKIENDNYYLGADGVAVTGEYKIGEYTYQFDEEGKLTKLAFVNEDGTLATHIWITNPVTGKMNYLGDDGLPVTGTQKITDEVETNKEDVTESVTLTYTFDDNGDLVNGAFHKQGFYTYYYIAGIKQRGWHYVDGYWYYMDRKTGYGMASLEHDGKTSVDKVEDGKYPIEAVDGTTLFFTFDKDGKLVKGALSSTKNGKVFYWANNERLSGWQYAEDAIYYFDSIDFYAVTGEQIIDETVYTFTEDGKLVLKEENFELNGKYYYFDQAGEIVTEHIRSHPCEPEIIEEGNGYIEYSCAACGRTFCFGEKPTDPFIEFINSLKAFFEKIVEFFRNLFS